MKTTNQTTKAAEVINQRLKKTRMKIGDIIIPILVVVVLILLSLFVFVPMIESTIEFRNESKQINDKMDTLEDLESDLASLEEITLQADLIVAKKVIPESLKVSDFIYYIDYLANEKDLISKELTASDVRVVSSEDDTFTYGINGPLAYTGEFSKILEFLDELQTASPYIVSVEGITLRESQDASWNMSLTVTGYYIPAEIETVDLYQPFTLYTKFSTVMSVLRQKSEKLQD